MTDLLVRFPAYVKHKKVQRQRGTGKRRSVFLFRRKKETLFGNIIPIGVPQHIDLHRATEVTQTFSVGNIQQSVGRMFREHKPATLHYYQVEELAAKREFEVMFKDLPKGLGKTDFTLKCNGISFEEPVTVDAVPVSDIMKQWAALLPPPAPNTVRLSEEAVAAIADKDFRISDSFVPEGSCSFRCEYTNVNQMAIIAPKAEIKTDTI